jgi:hypothetical protein
LDLDIPPIYDILLQMPTHCPLCCKKKKDNRLATHNDMYGRVLFIQKGESSQQNVLWACLAVIAVVAASVAAAASPRNNYSSLYTYTKQNAAAAAVVQQCQQNRLL